MKNVLVFYSRIPTPLLVGKTRIGKEINNQKTANSLAKALIHDMLKTYYPTKKDNYDFIWYYRGNKNIFLKENPQYQNITFIEQLPGELSINYIHQKASQNYTNTAIVGSDLPLLSKQTILKSFSALKKTDCAIVPAEDGGYGLIAMKGYCDIYTKISNWESRSKNYNLFEETKTILRKQNLTLTALEKTFDIDFINDIKKLWNTISLNEKLKPQFSYLKKTFHTIKTHKKEFDL